MHDILLPLLHDYFQNDFGSMITINNNYEIKNQSTGEIVNIELKVCQDANVNTRFLACYVPSCNNQNLSICLYLIENLVKLLSLFNGIKTGIHELKLGHGGPEEILNLNKLIIYSDNAFMGSDINELNAFSKGKNVSLTIRSKEYLEMKNKFIKPLAFISYDREDQNIAKYIATELTRMLCPVWYDEFSLKVGNNLRESIEKGIRDAQKCILIISPSFLSNKGWPKKEYDMANLKEIIEKNDALILPIWVGVQSKAVYKYSLILGTKLALRWEDAETAKLKIVQQLYREIKQS